MADLIACPTCGAPDQEAGKYCEQCGSKVTLPDAAAGATPPDDSTAAPSAGPDVPPAVPDAGPDGPVAPAAPAPAGDAAPQADAPPPAAPVPDAAPTATSAAPDAGADALATMRFIRLQNGVFNREHAFDVPVGARLMVGRTDPMNGVFPEVDVTMWSARVPTPEGPLYTIHRKQCVISRDAEGRVWIVDYPDYEGDTMVSPTGSAQFRSIPSLAGERPTNDEGGIALEVGDRILMGQGEGMLIFVLMQV